MSLHSPENQEKIMLAMVAQVPFEGWTLEALRLAVLDAGFEKGDEYRAFEGDPKQVLEAFFAWTDQKMRDKLEAMDLDQMRIRDRIATAIMVRLRLLAPYKEAVRKTLSTLAHPSYGPRGLKLLGKTVSDMWYAAGDQSTDFNYYTKRTLLAGVYVSTLWVWLDDASPDLSQTQDHLHKRIDQVMKIPTLKTEAKKLASLACHLPSQIFSSFFKDKG